MSMTTDRVAAHRVAWLVLVVSCGPAVRPAGPADEPPPVARTLARPEPTPVGRQLVVGEMCPQGADGRPAVAPLVMRTISWTDDAAEVSAVVERGSVPRFLVLGADGTQAGVFDTVGATDVGLPQSVAVGSYVGASPCTIDDGGGQRVELPACRASLADCGLAVAEISRPDFDLPETPRLATGAACVAGDGLVVDIDRDGVNEVFPLASLLDGGRSPASEWSAAPSPGAGCAPAFQVHDVRLVLPPEPGKPVDPKWTVTLDVLGVLDLDGDARDELVLALRFPTARTVVVYTPTGSAQRLELAGEGQSFPR